MKIYFVDAFTSEPFKGNPAAVCIAENELTETLMQAIAIEIGFSETAFVRHLSGNEYGIRFFSVKKEIPLCGHATLAAAKVIFESTRLPDVNFYNIDNTRLHTVRSGQFTRMLFPVYETTPVPVPRAMLEALGITGMKDAVYNHEFKVVVIETSDEQPLQELQPDFPALLRSYTGINGVVVTTNDQAGNFDFQYRYFWPWSGSNEDPVAGGVQTFLTKYWAGKLDKTSFRIFQASARTGIMHTELVGDKLFIYGEAIVVLEGNINIKTW